MNEAVVFDAVDKSFAEGPEVLSQVSFDIAEGEFVCLLGASGCGKSTLLSMIAQLERPSGGAIEVTEGGAAFMFQDASLFPWLTAEQNIMLALRLAEGRCQIRQRKVRRQRAAELLDLVRLSDHAGRRPHELSGGMRQRVALARALAQERPVLLMDEPFGALDAITRSLLHEELLRIWRATGRTIVFVTHSVDEAVHLGQRVLLLSSRPGRIIGEWEVSEQDRDGARRAGLVDEITERLRSEVGRHGGHAN
ncbi:ABC transporter ATP-binding protein [Nesterenkonia suensis]